VKRTAHTEPYGYNLFLCFIPFATGVVDPGGKSLIPVVHLDLKYFREVLKKF
jgi:hypothetical protein